MAAGQGYIEFATGDVLTASAANGYLASQVVMVFADAAARTSAIASPQEGMISYLKDTNSTEYYSGSAWAAIGGGGASGAMTLLNTGSTSMSGSATKTISSIPSTYNELWIYMYGVTNSVANSTMYLNVNSDSTSGNYPNGAWWGTPGVAGNAFSSENTTFMSLNAFGASFWPNNTNNFTSMQIQGYTRAGSKNINYQQGLDGMNKTGLCMYEGSSAIDSITITTSSSFTAGTIEVYGVK